jgi:hypothetical protein
MRRHFDCKNCSFLMQLRTHLQSNTLNPSLDRWAASRATQRSWRTGQFSSKSRPSTPYLWAAFFHTCLTSADQVSCVSTFTPKYRDLWTDCIGCPDSCIGQGLWFLLAALTKTTAVPLVTLTTTLQFRSQSSGLLRYAPTQVMRNDGVRDVVTRTMSLAHCPNSMWREGVCMSITCKLNSTGKTSAPWNTSVSLPRHVHRVFGKDVWNLRHVGTIWVSPGKMASLGRLAYIGHWPVRYLRLWPRPKSHDT